MLFNKEKINEKTYIDKTLVNSWISFLSDIWGNRMDIIEQKLIYNIQDRFIWNSEAKNYVNEMMLKLNKYKN